MEPRAIKRAVAVAMVVAALAMAAWWVWRRDRSPGSPTVAPVLAPVVPSGVRVRVEVLNASAVRGLARRATLYLRDMGFDVVRFDNDNSRRDTTLVLDRTGHPEWARLASGALGGAPVESRPDSSRFVDLTILLGTNWRPPAQPFHP
ncbi:MAG: LytR C-terminal domain-containing protein [Gemmatimonadaceae bacterium]